MNCASHQPDPAAGGPSQVVVTLLASDALHPTAGTGTTAVNELVLREEMNRRAEVITDVLAGIMDQPAAFRHWGLNE